MVRQTHDRADREIDAAGDDQDAGAQAEDAVQADALAQVEMVVGAAGPGIGQQQQHINHEQKQKQSQQLLHAIDSPPVAKCITACWESCCRVS